MKGSNAVYLGKLVSKEHFRVFVYSPNGSTHLVESWEEFEGKMQSGLWFATKEDAQVSIAEKPKSKRIKKPIEITEEPLAPSDEVTEVTNEDVAFEVKNDDFLPTK